MFLKILLHLPFRRYLWGSDHLGTFLSTGDPKSTMGPQYSWSVPYHLEITCFLFEVAGSLKAGALAYFPSCPMPPNSTWHVAGTQQVSGLHRVRFPSVMGILRRGCESDPGSWQPSRTGGICVGLVVAKNVGSLLQDQEKVLCQRKLGNTPATHYFWLIVCLCL